MTPAERQAAHDKARHALEHDLKRRASRQRRGCLLLIATPIVGFIALMWIAISDAREWARMRPRDVSETAWADRQDRCKVAGLNAVKCAAMPVRDIEALAAKADAVEHEKLCAEDVPEDARREARKAVKEALKAPSNAAFGDNDGVTHKGCTWIVSGEVDAQNSFGATLRQRWRITLRRLGRDVWLPVATEIR